MADAPFDVAYLVEVSRSRRARRISIRVFPDGHVRLTIPYFVSLAEGQKFFKEHLDWIEKIRAREAAKPPRPAPPPLTKEQLDHFHEKLFGLHKLWMERLGEGVVMFRYRKMKTIWASCHWKKRVITYNTELVRVPERFYEYVVVHEMTHFKAHNHGPQFKALMDARLPNWRLLRKELNTYSLAP